MCDAGIPLRDTPLYITPQFENLSLDYEPSRQHLVSALNTLEDTSEGKVRAGYTHVFFPYLFFVKQGDHYVIDETRLDKQLAVAAELNRPFVAYLFSNHFMPTDDVPLVKALLQDSNNLMQFRDGTSPSEQYFRTGIVPFRLTNDLQLDMVTYRHEAMELIATKLAAFQRQYPELLIGIMLGGETHYMFNDFFHGTGNFATPELTDYHPDELALFADWVPSGVDTQHIRDIAMNRYEWGTVPVSGWIAPLSDHDRLRVYVNGRHVGDAKPQLNRMDVYQQYQAKATKLTEPNTGFVYEYDYRHLSAGRYYLEVLLQRDGRLHMVGSRWLDVSPQEAQYQDHMFPGAIERASLPSGVEGYVDAPRDDTVLQYEPVARLWMQFRASRIASYVEAMAVPFREAGFTKDQLYSYQLTPWLNGNWNPHLFGIGKEFFSSTTMRPGITMYGGNMHNPHIFQLIAGHSGYGIPEIHPQSAFSADYLRRMWREHYCQGATFISPYFMKLRGGKKAPSDHDKMVISPDNPVWGSDTFYHSIRELLRH